MADARALRSALPILIGAGLMLTIGMGIRQSFGLFMQPLTRPNDGVDRRRLPSKVSGQDRGYA